MRRSLSLVIPAFNEEKRLPRLLSVLEAGARRIGGPSVDLREIIIVDDGSTDSTALRVDRAAPAIEGLRLIRLPTNRGKGAAVRAGMLAARSDLGLLSDADLSTPLEEVGLLLQALNAGYDVAIGSRALSNSQLVVRQPAHRELSGRAFSVLMRQVTGLPFRDTQCGFKLFFLPAARAVFNALSVPGYAYDVEFLIRAKQLGLRVAEVGVRWEDRAGSQLRLLPASAEMARDLIRLGLLARRARVSDSRATSDQNRSARSPEAPRLSGVSRWAARPSSRPEPYDRGS